MPVEGDLTFLIEPKLIQQGRYEKTFEFEKSANLVPYHCQVDKIKIILIGGCVV